MRRATTPLAGEGCDGIVRIPQLPFCSLNPPSRAEEIEHRDELTSREQEDDNEPEPDWQAVLAPRPTNQPGEGCAVSRDPQRDDCSETRIDAQGRNINHHGLFALLLLTDSEGNSVENARAKLSKTANIFFTRLPPHGLEPYSNRRIITPAEVSVLKLNIAAADIDFCHSFNWRL